MSYDVVRRIGRGGMGVVDLGVDEHGQEVALKRLSLHGTPEELATARQRIKREAEVLRALDHPGIVRLRDVVDDGDDLVLVMDHLSGGTLAQRVAEDGPLPPDEVGELADRLVDALAAAHRQGIVHRDIKPANVLFDAAGQPHLADFGAASNRDVTLGPHRQRDGRRHARLHVARAGPGRTGDGGLRRVLPRCDAGVRGHRVRARSAPPTPGC